MDFAGVVAQHGPITEIVPGVKKAGKGEKPVKGCPECHELVGISARECPACGYQFPPPKIKKLELHNEDILNLEGYSEMRVTDWMWRVHVSQASGKYMLKVSYYGGLSEQAITEYFAITHLGYAGDKAMRELASIAARCGADCKGLGQLSLDEIVEKLNACAAPSVINYKRDGKFHRIIARDWIKEVAYG
jgi:DNA repair protein RadD